MSTRSHKRIHFTPSPAASSLYSSRKKNESERGRVKLHRKMKTSLSAHRKKKEQNFKLTKWMINGGNTFCSACSHSPKIAFTFCQCLHSPFSPLTLFLPPRRWSKGGKQKKATTMLVNYTTPRTKRRSRSYEEDISRGVFSPFFITRRLYFDACGC